MNSNRKHLGNELKPSAAGFLPICFNPTARGKVIFILLEVWFSNSLLPPLSRLLCSVLSDAKKASNLLFSSLKQIRFNTYFTLIFPFAACVFVLDNEDLQLT